jgi:hypothetical protein
MVETLGILGNENLQGKAEFPALHFSRFFHAFDVAVPSSHQGDSQR